MKITVTRNDIKCGIPMNRGISCPVTLALRRALPLRTVRFCTFSGADIGGCEYRLPKSVYRFMEAFDTGRTVKPFSFSLRGL